MDALFGSLSDLYLPGAVPLWCAVIFGVASFIGYSQAATSGDRETLAFARRSYSFYALAIVLVSVVLAICLLRRDFRIEYVFQYSSIDLPTQFQFAAFWAGQKGSFLIWLLFASLLGLPLMRSCGKGEPWVMRVYLMTLFALLFILVRENPFVMLAEAPADGESLNPLLQDGWMVIHPPVMFVGYSAAAIPFSFAVAAMLRRDTDTWASRSFPWTLGGFLVLGTAIMMGGYWAYKTLGWGGYWGWDPVENASLIPWLIGIVLIHGLYLERTKGRFRRANLIAACLLYLSVLYGTFLTRSGVLADFSVHSFVELGISGWLVAIMLFFLVLCIYLLATRLPKVPTRRNEDPLLSRGFFLVLSTMVVLVSAIAVTFGTSAPILTRFMENQGQVGPEWYNTVNQPLAIAAAFLVAMVPFLTWKGTAPAELLRRLAPSAVVALIACGIAFAYGLRDILHLFFIFLSALAAATNLHKTWAKARSGGLGAAGGYLAHVGVGVMFIGFLISSAYDQSTKVTLEQGVTQQVDNLSLTFKRFIPRQGKEKERMEVEVVRKDGFTYHAYPKLFVNQRTRQLMSNPHVRKLPLQDLYISPIQYDPGAPPTIDQRFRLARGESRMIGDLEVRFVDFNMVQGNPMAQLASGDVVTIGADLEIKRGGESQALTALYSFRQDGQVSTPPTQLPGGGWLAMSGIVPTNNEVQIDLAGLSSDSRGASPTLAIDLTRKPLMNMVWYGLYVVLLGGLISTINRWRQSRIAARVAAER